MYNLYVMDIKSSDRNCSYTRTLHPMSMYFALAFSNDNLFITFFHTSPPLFNVKNVKTTSLQSYNYENTMFVFKFFFYYIQLNYSFTFSKSRGKTENIQEKLYTVRVV